MYKTEWDCWAKIYRGEGIVGFLKGYTATCYRQMVFSSVYFVIYQIVKSNLLSYLSGWNLLCFFLSGLLAGTIGSISNNPLDVVKTRIQNDTFMNPVLHNSTTILGPLHVLQKIYRTEGYVPISTNTPKPTSKLWNLPSLSDFQLSTLASQPKFFE